MNSYLITNPSAAYTGRIEEFIRHPRRGRGRKQDESGNAIGDVPQVIKSREEFDNETFKKAFYNPSGADTVFIVPELFWDRYGRVDAGYRVAQELLEGKLKDKFFRLVFISFYRRDQLRRMVNIEFLEMVNAFPHLTLDSLMDYRQENPKPKVELPAAYSPIQFELLKRTVVSRPGRIDYLLHNISDLEKTELETAKSKIEPILKLLSLPAFGGEDEANKESLSELKELFAQMSKPEEQRKCGEKLRIYLNRLKNYFATRSGAPSHKMEYSVLIIEDDDEYRNNMKEFFEERFAKVEAWGPESIKDARKKIVESVSKGEKEREGRFDLILIDLLYTESGKAGDYILPFNGLDLLGDLRLAESRVITKRGTVRHAAVRIVSSLPRDVISRLVGLHTGMDTPTVFTKGGGWEQLQGCLIDRMDEMVKECQYYRNYMDFLESFNRPRTGVFGVDGAAEMLLKNKTALEHAIERAREVVSAKQKMEKKDISLVSPGRMKDLSQLESHLESTVLHRRLVIAFSFENNREFNEDKYRDFVKPYGIELERYNRDYLTTKLGFTLLEAPSGDERPFCCEIEMKREKFFDGELTIMQRSIVPNPETTIFIKQLIEELKSRAEEDKNYEEFFSTSGIQKFLDGDKTAESLLEMLQTVCKYVKDKNVAEHKRVDIWDIFETLFSEGGQFCDSVLRTKIRECSPEMDDLITNILNAFSP